MKVINFVIGLFIISSILMSVQAFARKVHPISTYNMGDILAERDTIKPRYDDFINDTIKNPFDLNDPSIVEKKVEYDPKSGLYIITEKIGDDYFRAPTYMTFEEFLKWKNKQQRLEYFRQLSGSGDGNRSKRGIVDPASFVGVQKDLVERIFGGNEITIKPQGSIHLTLGASRQIMDNPRFELNAQRVWNPIFDEGIQVNVEGGIGDKMKLNFNYNTKASFDFDNKIKLKYDSEQFNEDAILKKIEAGNVSLPLRGRLIQGAQNLFGLKTELQFGHLRITAIASQQRSEQKNLSIDKGAVKQEFEITPDKYDENRHFFISHFNRATYEESLKDLPNIKTPFRITRMDVWVIPERNETHDLRDICAISDLGEGQIENYSTKKNLYETPPYDNYQENYFKLKYNSDTLVLPDNDVSLFYSGLGVKPGLKSDDQARLKTNVSTMLRSRYKMKSGKDFEVFKGRKLNTSEYSYNEKLGFISLNRPLQPEDVLGVSYEYTYSYNDEFGNRTDTIFRVGEFNEFSDTIGRVMFVKMLKSKSQSPNLPEWDLMMKNAYYIGGSDIDRESFKLDVYYEDVHGAKKRFIPDDPDRQQLLEVFNLDNLNIVGDRQPDGIFDFIPGITVIPRSGSIMFPVLEPFGRSLEKLLDDPLLAQKYAYNELYDTSIVIAQKHLSKNKFLLIGEYKSKESSEISLGSWNIQGNPIVTSGGKTLVEGVDYDLDRGAGKIRIINPAILQSGRPVNVRFEDNSLFNLTQKNLLGLRADYEISKNFNVGATYLHLFERPYTQKVSYGDDPINNRMFGLDVDYSTEADWLTRAIDKLPLISTKAPSKISFKSEVAALKPGHSSAINSTDEEEKGGQIILDDFEGASVKLYMNNENDWMLSSTPNNGFDFPESTDTTLAYGANRALLSWYVAESGGTGDDPYTRPVLQKELFKKDIPIGSLPYLRCFDVNFYPSERGPYNFDIPQGYPGFSAGVDWDEPNKKIILKKPESRWGGIMRYMRFSDFEKLNMEYVEFWMLNPFMQTDSRPEHNLSEKGELVINLGNVSEDVLKDGLQFYENSLPLKGDYVPKEKTIWGEIPNDTPLDDAFPNNTQEIELLDLGLDGLDDTQEKTHYIDYINKVKDPITGFPTATFSDVSNDNWVYFNSPDVQGKNLLERYKKYNNTQGNFPDREKEERRGKLRPDKEELNDNKSLDITESYYEYKLELPIATDGNGEMVLDTSDAKVKKYVTDIIEVTPRSGKKELWYRFRVPIDPDALYSINGITGLRSIQFMRMYFTGFEKPKTFRLAEFAMVRNQWRKKEFCFGDPTGAKLNLDVVGVEENQGKTPFGYRTPVGVKRDRVLANYENIRLDEKSLALKFENLLDTCVVSVYKHTTFDARLFKRLQMFAHAESNMDINEGDLKMFVRIGKDFKDNYYEYELPLKLSVLADGNTDENIWPDANNLDINLKDFIDLKLERNNKDFPLSQIYSKQDNNNPNNNGAVLKIKGNPSLGYIKGIEIGLRNDGPIPLNGEVWINELRLSGLEEKGGIAATANLDIGLADLGSFNAAFNYMSVGFGALDEKLAQRSVEEVMDYDLSTSIQMGRFFPKKWGVSLPVYLQYGQTIIKPKYDPYDLDLTVDQNLANAKTEEEKQDFKDRSLDITTIKSFNVSNISINKGNSKYPWAPSNIKMGYFYTNLNAKNPIIENEDETDQKLTLDYGYSRGNKYIKPFKKIKWIKAKIFKDIHFNPLPNSFSFNTQLRRYHDSRTYRKTLDEPDDLKFTFEDRRFNWDRNYNLQWNFTKDLKLNFTAQTNAIVDELKKYGSRDYYVDAYGVTRSIVGTPEYITQKDYLNESLRKFGRTKDYHHTIDLSYKVPLKNIPFMKWIKINAKYRATYNWMGETPSLVEDLGNIISNTQIRTIDARFDFEKLYKNVKYLNKIDKGFSGKKKSKKKRRKKPNRNSSKSSKKKEKKDREPSAFEKIILRPLLAFRDIKLKYSEDLGTTAPGYKPSTELLGTTDNFNAPGYDFVLGLQPSFESGGWLDKAENNKWIVTDKYFNSLFYQRKKQNFSVKIKLEPINHLKVDIDFKKSYTKDASREFKNTSITNVPQFESIAKMDRGMFEVTYFAMNTIFTKNYESLFKTFSKYRETISKRQAALIGVTETIEGKPNYFAGFGPQSQSVLIPAFLAAYTGENPDNVPLKIYNDIGKIDYIPAPNWRADYNLNRYSFLKDIFSSFKITHGYKSVLKVSSFQTDLNWGGDSKQNGKDENEHNYYAEYIIPSMVLEERFEPLIGVDIKTKSDLSLRVDYKKSRMLLLSQKSLQQTRSEEIVFNMGYVIKNVYIPLITKRPKKKRGKKGSIVKEKTGRKSKSAKNNLRDLRISFDFSLRDNEVTEYLFDKGRKGKPTHGNYRISIAPTLEYNVTDNFSLQMDFSYDETKPYVNNSYPSKNYRGTITAKYSLK